MIALHVQLDPNSLERTRPDQKQIQTMDQPDDRYSMHLLSAPQWVRSYGFIEPMPSFFSLEITYWGRAIELPSGIVFQAA
jgi:hypothetical protein